MIRTGLKISDNTRKVLFEKQTKYYFKTYNRGLGLCEDCLVYNAKIGSAFCATKCEFNKGSDGKENYVICSKIIALKNGYIPNK